jgi:hypothetical protein
MSRFILAAFGAFAIAGVAAAQQPPVAAPPAAAPAAPPATATPPAAVAPAPGPTVIRGGGCTGCGTAAPLANVRGAIHTASGGNCHYGYGCQNGCGSVKSDLAFHFGSCKDFFAPNGPTCGSLHGSRCGYQGFAQPFGTGWNCPRQYDTYMNH